MNHNEKLRNIFIRFRVTQFGLFWQIFYLPNQQRSLPRRIERGKWWWDWPWWGPEWDLWACRSPFPRCRSWWSCLCDRRSVAIPRRGVVRGTSGNRCGCQKRWFVFCHIYTLGRVGELRAAIVLSILSKVIQSNLDFALNLEFTLKSPMTKFKIYKILYSFKILRYFSILRCIWCRETIS